MSNKVGRLWLLKWCGLFLCTIMFTIYSDCEPALIRYSWYRLVPVAHLLLIFLVANLWYMDRRYSKKRYVFRKRSRPRRAAKWVAGVGCVLLFVAWQLPSPGDLCYRHGSFELRWRDGYLEFMFCTTKASSADDGLTMLPLQYPAPGDLEYQRMGSWQMVGIPLWLPFLMVAIAANLIWWRDARYLLPNGCLSCGYDLTGNVSGVCPECGAALSEEQKKKLAGVGGTRPRQEGGR